MFTSWVQGTTRRMLASITIVDYTGAIGVTFNVSVPSLLTLLCPVLDTFVEPTEEVVSTTICREESLPGVLTFSTSPTIAPPSMDWNTLTSVDILARDRLMLSGTLFGPK
jgi:hypothetical protein